MGFIAAYITCPDAKTAGRIIEKLVKERIVACGNAFPIRSTYWWQGKVHRVREVVALVKTKSSKWRVLVSEVKKFHPYELPCIMRINVSANAEYERWINEETRQKIKLE